MRRRPGGGGNMGGMMKQIQKLQRDMEKAQAEIEEREFECTAGGGAIKVKINGKREILGIELQPEIVDPEDIEMLQDLIITAVNDAINTVDETTADEMGQFTGSMNIPGLM